MASNYMSGCTSRQKLPRQRVLHVANGSSQPLVRSHNSSSQAIKMIKQAYQKHLNRGTPGRCRVGQPLQPDFESYNEMKKHVVPKIIEIKQRRQHMKQGLVKLNRQNTKSEYSSERLPSINQHVSPIHHSPRFSLRRKPIKTEIDDTNRYIKNSSIDCKVVQYQPFQRYKAAVTLRRAAYVQRLEDRVKQRCSLKISTAGIGLNGWEDAADGQVFPYLQPQLSQAI